tara:strand:- start:6508 stop:6849 length:342 start_codon:yes stop_codon:yes gene_type:complete
MFSGLREYAGDVISNVALGQAGFVECTGTSTKTGDFTLIKAVGDAANIVTHPLVSTAYIQVTTINKIGDTPITTVLFPGGSVFGPFSSVQITANGAGTVAAPTNALKILCYRG